MENFRHGLELGRGVWYGFGDLERRFFEGGGHRQASIDERPNIFGDLAWIPSDSPTGVGNLIPFEHLRHEDQTDLLVSHRRMFVLGVALEVLRQQGLLPPPLEQLARRAQKGPAVGETDVLDRVREGAVPDVVQ